MNFLADECCDTALVQALREDGHDVFYVLESLRGANDDDILARAFAENRLLLTEDKDLGNWSTGYANRLTELSYSALGWPSTP